MKRMVISAIALMISTVSFAGMQPMNPGKQTQKLQALGQAWKSYHSLQGNRPKDDIEMVYGGADINPPVMNLGTINA